MGGTGSRPPRLGGRYVAVQLLGKGAQARVYLAFDERTRSWVAAKVLDRRYLEDEEIRRRFLREADTMRRLEQPYLLRVLDVGSDGPVPWIILELARGGALTQWIRRNGPLSPAMAVAVTLQAAEGLHHAHQHGVIHRDVKPHNLLIAGPQRVVVTDFGVARAEDASMTATGTVMGTFAYMAPEQRSDAKSVDARCDVYSLAVTLYTLITGKPSAELFYAESDDDIMQGIPEALRPVLLKAAAYRRDDRYAHMEAFAVALQGVRKQLTGELHGLDDDWLPLPDGPPRQLAPGALEDLRDELGLDDAHPTFVPSNRAALEEHYEADQTVLQHSSSAGGEGYDEAPTVHVRPSDRGRLPSDYFDYESEDASTMRPAPKADPTHSQPMEVVEVTEASWSGALRTAATSCALGAVMASMVWLAAVGTNVLAQWSVDRAASDLAATAATAHTAVAPLADQGVATGPLVARFEAWEASGAPDDALAFALALGDAADAASVDDLARARIDPLLDAAERYQEASVELEAQRRSVLGRLSLGVGL
jgi:serine/threonine protein kinase